RHAEPGAEPRVGEHVGEVLKPPLDGQEPRRGRPEPALRLDRGEEHHEVRGGQPQREHEARRAEPRAPHQGSSSGQRAARRYPSTATRITATLITPSAAASPTSRRALLNAILYM